MVGAEKKWWVRKERKIEIFFFLLLSRFFNFRNLIYEFRSFYRIFKKSGNLTLRLKFEQRSRFVSSVFCVFLKGRRGGGRVEKRILSIQFFRKLCLQRVARNNWNEISLRISKPMIRYPAEWKWAFGFCNPPPSAFFSLPARESIFSFRSRKIKFTSRY